MGEASTFTSRFDGEMSAERSATGVPPEVVLVDVVSGIVHKLTEVSKHTTSASNAMRHLVAEIAQLRELRARDVTSVAEVFATIGSRSWSPIVVDYGTWKSATTDQAVGKLQ